MKKKSFIGLLAAITVMLVTAVMLALPSFAYTEVLYGDANADNKVNAKDVIIMLKSLADWDVKIDEAAANVDCNNAFNAKDAIAMLKYLANWDVTLGPEWAIVSGNDIGFASKSVETFATALRKIGNTKSIKSSSDEGFKSNVKQIILGEDNPRTISVEKDEDLSKSNYFSYIVSKNGNIYAPFSAISKLTEMIADGSIHDFIKKEQTVYFSTAARTTSFTVNGKSINGFTIVCDEKYRETAEYLRKYLFAYTGCILDIAYDEKDAKIGKLILKEGSTEENKIELSLDGNTLTLYSSENIGMKKTVVFILKKLFFTDAEIESSEPVNCDFKNGNIFSFENVYAVGTKIYTDASEELIKYLEYMKKSAYGTTRNEKKAYELLDSLENINGSYGWSDIDYSAEYPSAHLDRITKICKYLGEDGLAALSQDYVEKFNMAIYKWLSGNYYVISYYTVDNYGRLIETMNLSPKWWYTDIGTPSILYPILLMAGDLVGEDIISTIYLEHHYTVYGRDNTDYREIMTGANLYDVISNSLYYYAFMGNYEAALSCIQRFEDSIYILDSSDIHYNGLYNGKDDGGIASDGSFWQHFIAYGAGYGTSNDYYTATFLKFMKAFGIEPSKEKLEILSYYVTESYKLTAHGNYGYMFVGRANGQSSKGYLGSGLTSVAAALLLFDDVPNREELEYIIAEAARNVTQKCSIKYFADCLVSAMKTEYVTMLARGARNDTGIIEGAEDLNRLCRNTSYGGQTEYMADGSEYVGLQGVWDWSLVPGTTAYHESDEELIQWELDNQKGWLNTFTTTGDYCDGKSDESTSTVYLKMVNEEGLTAYKSYFSYAGITVCLGADITDTSGNSKTVNTSVEQTRYTDATVNGESIYDVGTVEITDGSAVKNGSFAYYCLDGSTMYASAESRTGNINRVATEYNQEVTDKVLTVWLTHGVNPQNASYAYAVSDNGDGTAPDNAGELGITVLENSNDIQAVKFADGTVIAVFHDTSKSLTVDDNTLSATDEDRVVIVH